MANRRNTEQKAGGGSNFSLAKEYDKLLFIPLGGCDEIGLNMNLYHYQGKWIMADCGAGFAGVDMPGVIYSFPISASSSKIKLSLRRLSSLTFMKITSGLCFIYSNIYHSQFIAQHLPLQLLRKNYPISRR